MKLGVSTSCYYPLETELALEEVGKSGVKTTELFFNATRELKPSFIDLLREIQDRYGIEIVSIHPTLSFTEAFMMFSNYERRCLDAEDSFRRYGEIAAELGANYIILHGGKTSAGLEDEAYCERFMRLKEAVRQNGATLLQENVARRHAGDLEFLRAMRDILGDEAEFCIDIKQALRCGNDPMALVREFLPHTRHLHISDHSVASDCLLPGNGGFDFGALFSCVAESGYTGAAIIEVYRDAYRSYGEITNSYENLKKMLINK